MMNSGVVLWRLVVCAGGLLVGAISPGLAGAEGVQGATSIDTSAFALGKARLNVIFLESDGSIDINQENWSAEQLTNVHREIGEATSFWEGLTAGEMA